MLKFIRGKGTHLSAERIKIQKELYAYRKTVTHGFPSKPTALGYDKELGLLAIGNKAGYLVVVGQPGVEFAGQHPSEDFAVIRIVFVPKTAKLITLCDNNSLHLWRFRNSHLELVKSYPLEGKLKKISSIAVKADGKQAYIGTEGGNIYNLDIDKFQVGDKIIYLDVVLQNGPENYKVNPGAVESILEVESGEEPRLVIGYERGLIVLWDITSQKNLRNFVSNQQLENLCWYEDGNNSLFVSSHNDGSYVLWDIETGSKPKKDATTPYGPFPCKRIGKMKFWDDEDGERMCAFSGGMPRAAYGDHFTVSVKSESASSDGPHVTFDLSSKVIDFMLLYPLRKGEPAPQQKKEKENNEENDNDDEDDEEEEANKSKIPTALAILAEEELVMIDLTSDNWPSFYPLPYLNSIHPSAVTCFQHVDSVTDQVYNILKKIGVRGEHSKNLWPIMGGKLFPRPAEPSSQGGGGGKTTGKKQPKGKCLLITGHEDGSVRFWNYTDICLTLLAKFSSSVLFSSIDDLDGPIHDSSNNAKDDEDEEWPPFRKVGVFDPYSDDPRLAVKKIGFCPTTGVLVVGGTAGQVVVVNSLKRGILEEPSKLEITNCNLVADKDGFAWKGHGPLEFKPKNNPNIGNREGEESFVVGALLQISPPAAVTALALDAPTGVTAVGTAHGVLLYDFFRRKVVITRSTLNPNDLMAAGDTPISRRKSIKKSLRESFRRLRKGRSQRQPNSPIKSPSMSTIQSPNEPPSKSVERAIEARDESMTSMVRCVTFAKTYIVSLQTTTPTLWVGTNAGTVYVFTINIPGGEKRSKEDVGCQIAKEIQLKHRAPVLSVIVLDCNAGTVDGFSPQHDHLGPHKVIISSEEQVKIFTLPALRPSGKLKLTAQEGSRLRGIRVQTFASSSDPSYTEKCLSCITNQGDVYVIAVPELRKQIVFHQCLKREDITGISSFTFNEFGEAVYQISSSELQRISISTSGAVFPRCSIDGKFIVEEPNVLVVKLAVGESNHHHNLNPSSSTIISPSTSTNASISRQQATEVTDDATTEPGDITIDSVRDHTNSSPIPPAAVSSSSTTVVEERLIDGGTLLSSSSNSTAEGVKSQIRSVTTVTTTTVVNSVQNTSASNPSGSTSTTASSETTFVRAPLAPQEENEETSVCAPRESAL